MKVKVVPIKNKKYDAIIYLGTIESLIKMVEWVDSIQDFDGIHYEVSLQYEKSSANVFLHRHIEGCGSIGSIINCGDMLIREDHAISIIRHKEHEPFDALSYEDYEIYEYD